MNRRLSSLALCIRNTGLRTTLIYKWDRIRTALGSPAAGILALKPKGLSSPLWLRRGKSSDMDVYRAIFIEGEYESVTVAEPPRLILDLGANIGASAVYFLNRFPEARVVAIEPDADNFDCCRRNLAPYGDRAILVNGAVWSHPCQLEIHSFPAGEGKEWAVTVSELTRPGATGVRAWDLPSLAALAGPAGQIDILKVDIEGSERQLFSSSAGAWLPRVRNICIELHGQDCDDVFFAALKPWNYTVTRSGELTICSGLAPVPVSAGQ